MCPGWDVGSQDSQYLSPRAAGKPPGLPLGFSLADYERLGNCPGGTDGGPRVYSEFIVKPAPHSPTCILCSSQVLFAGFSPGLEVC